MSSHLATALRASLAGAGLLVALTTAGAAQTTPASTAPTATTPADVAGSWTGEYFIQQGQGPMAMTFTKADSGWGGTVEVTTPERTLKGPIGSVAIDGAAVTVKAFLDGADVTFTAKLEGGELVGKLVATQGGNTVAEGDWSAHRTP